MPGTKAEALIGAVLALGMGMIATTEEMERITIMLAILCRVVGRNTTPALDLYLCRVARDHDLNDHVRMYQVLKDGSSNYDRVDFLSMAGTVRGAFTGQVLSASGNGTDTFTNRIKVAQVMTSAEVITRARSWAGQNGWTSSCLRCTCSRPWHKRACGEFLFQAAACAGSAASLISRSLGPVRGRDRGRVPRVQ